MLHAFLLLAPSAQAKACPIPQYRPPGLLGSPLRGPVPPGFALRPEGQVAYPEVWDNEGYLLPLSDNGEEQYQVPADLPPGEYVLRDLLDYGGAWTVEVVDNWAPESPAQDMQFVQALWGVERNGPRFSPCDTGDGRRHTYETLTLWVPPSAQPGWAIRLEDSSTGTAWWMALHPESREVVWTQDIEPGADQVIREERCLAWELYDPIGLVERQGSFPCESREEAPGCSSTPSKPGLLGGLLLLGLLLRRPVRRQRG